MPVERDLRAVVAPVLAWLDGLPPEQRARQAHVMWGHLIEIQAHIARARRSGVREMRIDHTLEQIGALLGISITRVKQIEAGVERKEMTNSGS